MKNTVIYTLEGKFFKSKLLVQLRINVFEFALCVLLDKQILTEKMN